MWTQLVHNIWLFYFIGSSYSSKFVSVARFKQVLESFGKYILRNESRATTNSQLTERTVALLVDRHTDVTRIPQQLRAELLDELKTASEHKVFWLFLTSYILRWTWKLWNSKQNVLTIFSVNDFINSEVLNFFDICCYKSHTNLVMVPIWPVEMLQEKSAGSSFSALTQLGWVRGTALVLLKLHCVSPDKVPPQNNCKKKNKGWWYPAKPGSRENWPLNFSTYLDWTGWVCVHGMPFVELVFQLIAENTSTERIHQQQAHCQRRHYRAPSLLRKPLQRLKSFRIWVAVQPLGVMFFWPISCTFDVGR